MQEKIDQAKASFLQAKGRLCRSLETTPDDRINWSPSPTARTPIQQVAHAAWAIKSINEMLDGRTFAVKTTEEAEKGFREWEQPFTTRDQVLGLLEKNGAEYEAWLDKLTPERMESTVKLPFNLGFAPMAAMLGVAADHTNWHAAQIDYIQTVYGDHDWHL